MDHPDLQQFFCWNAACPLYRQRGQGNLYRHSWSDRHKTIRLLACRRCRKTFSERRGTALFDTKIPQDKAVTVLEHLVEGVGIRPTHRLCKVAKQTVQRLARHAGAHAQQFHDTFVRQVKPREVQLDEAWAFVGKKRQALRPGRPR